MYIRRRQEQSIEIQQMRYFEEQQQKVRTRLSRSRKKGAFWGLVFARLVIPVGLLSFQEKRRIFARERQLRIQAEQRRDEIERKLIEYQEQMKEIHETLVRASRFAGTVLIDSFS